MLKRMINDLSFNSTTDNEVIDFYTTKEVNYNFISKELKNSN